MAAVDATDCAMDGTVICASRAEGLVDRVGWAAAAAASGRGGMARGRAWTGATACLAGAVFGVTGAPFAAGCFTTGLALGAGAAFLAAGAVLAGAFLAGAARTGDLATGFAGVFLAGALAAGFTGAFFAAAFAAGFAAFTAFAGAAAGFALAAVLVVLAETFG